MMRLRNDAKNQFNSVVAVFWQRKDAATLSCALKNQFNSGFDNKSNSLAGGPQEKSTTLYALRP